VSGDHRTFGASQFTPGVLAFSRILNESETLVVANTNMASNVDLSVLVDAALNPQGARFAIIYSTSGTTGICPLEVIGDTLVVEEEASRGTVSAVRVTLLPGEAQILSRLP
jgi:hypothetical protein